MLKQFSLTYWQNCNSYHLKFIFLAANLACLSFSNVPENYFDSVIFCFCVVNIQIFTLPISYPPYVFDI